MRNTIHFLGLLIVAIAIYGCGNSSSDIAKIVEERDSLRQQAEEQQRHLDNYVQTINTMSATLDSITVQENMIFTSRGEVPVTKTDVKYNLMRFENLLKKQEEKIKQLENKLSEDKESNAQSLSLIAHLREEIATKNNQIARLKMELEKKNVSIAQLQSQVESQRVTINTQSEKINELSQRTQKQNEALARQDAILNNGYVIVGSKADLKRKGITGKKGRLVADAILDRSKFMKVDIRKWTEVSFSAKKPKILTNMPASSYEITTSGDRNFTLHVKNPSDFWRVSNYLVIQTD